MLRKRPCHVQGFSASGAADAYTLSLLGEGGRVQTLIESRRDQIAELCRRHHVRQLSVFGSSVREDFDPKRSDVDLLVEFEPLSEMEYAPNYFALLDAFGQLFARKVDLIAANSIRNPYFKRAVEGEKELLYAA